VSDNVRLKVVSPPENAWSSSSYDVVIGKDILELLSTSMYVDPMTVYREYIQNAADSIDDARVNGILPATGGRVQVSIDGNSRSVRIRDDGSSIPWPEFVERLSNLGGSRKRGTSARGFRGVGRLSGLGYCQELLFRGRADDEELISELRWDGRALKTILRAADHSKNLRALVKDIVTVRRVKPKDEPKRFFEVELRGVIRHRDDRLLNEAAVADYLSQVAPLPFSPEFGFAKEITAALKPHVSLGHISVIINNAERPLYRPHEDCMKVDGNVEAKFKTLEILEMTGVDSGVAAIAWVLHHEYSGALPNRALVKGLRLRSGNIQIGDHALLDSLFPEPRFNSWAVGEIHFVDPKILANGRRDNFEHSVHFDNVLNQLAPLARDVARRCRQSSISRKWQREFDLHKEMALERAKTVSRGGITRAARQIHIDAALKSLNGMKKVLQTRYIDDEIRSALADKAKTVEARIQKLLGEGAAASDPLASLSSPKRTAYQHIISLIYECSANRVAAGALVERLLGRLADESAPKGKTKPSTKGAKRAGSRKSGGNKVTKRSGR
jgi:molecular chaperone HtpG